MRKKIQDLKNKKGFTLIELIVVIAVLGILVLLAAPKFLGYTKDANVAALQADAKTLSNAAIVEYVDSEKSGTAVWPVDSATTAEEITIGTETIKVQAFDESIMDNVNSLKGEIGDYALVVDGDREGEVIYVKKDASNGYAGVPDRDGNLHYGVDLEVPKAP